MLRFLALIGMVVLVLLAVGLVFFAMTRPAGSAPDQEHIAASMVPPATSSASPPASPPLSLSSIDDLARLTPEELTRLADGKVEVDQQNVESLTTDAGQRMDDLSFSLRELDQNFHVPPVRGRTSSTGGSGRPQAPPAKPPAKTPAP